MPKTGWKYTKQGPDKGKTNMLKKSAASSKPGRTAPKKGDVNMRSADTIQRLKMYNNGKAIRNKEGKIVGGQFMMKDRAGDTKITAVTGRIAPDRRWFGNTRVVGQTELDKFREEMSEKMADPYSVVLKRKQLPMGLLRDAAIALSTATNTSSKDPSAAAAAAGVAKRALKDGLLANEPFEHVFGSKNRRKRVKLDQYMIGRTSTYDNSQKEGEDKEEEDDKVTQHGKNQGGDNKTSLTFVSPMGGQATFVSQKVQDDTSAYTALLCTAQKSADTYDTVNSREGMVPWGRDSNIQKTEGEGVDWRLEQKADLFLKGQSRRIWGEFYKVVDCSDVILHVIDARDVPGTRCTMIEKHISKNASHKHLVFVLNKIDLVPNWVAKRWMGELASIRPTIAFHASLTHAFGKGALISLLRQFGKLHKDKKQISVGVIGYPNVGKSSVINTLISKKSCSVAPIPGQTKIWQYITLFRNIYLIDSPGVVVDTAGDTEIDSVLKGVVRAERLEVPEAFVDPILCRLKREHVAAHYGLPKDGEESWKDGMDLLEKIAMKCGRLLKGGEPCIRTSAIRLINDYQRGKLPHFVAPPDLKKDETMKKVVSASLPGIKGIEQDLSEMEKACLDETKIGEERISDEEDEQDDVMEEENESSPDDDNHDDDDEP